jgi:hypothetical protein
MRCGAEVAIHADYLAPRDDDLNRRGGDSIVREDDLSVR